MSESIIKVQGLSHRYSKSWAIKDINFEIKTHGILGLLGSNGAGKSTTMNIMCGVLNQTEGKVFIDGVDMQTNRQEAKKLIGFLPQNAPLYHDLTVDEYLIYTANLRLISHEKIAEAVEVAKHKCGISHFSKRLIKNLSGGYRQRVGIAQAIIHNPKIVVLDEPTNGLDPNQILEVRKLMKSIAQERAVILSTHILPEVQATCDEIRMIDHGRMVFSGTMASFNNYIQSNTLLIQLTKLPNIEALSNLEGISKVETLPHHFYRLDIDTKDADRIEQIVATSVSKGWGVQEVVKEKVSLEEIFAQLSVKQS
ncbi:ABC transporter ATP-binding protein [Flavivirga sp. 57AJ16]|uniref:ABC transporter ATP-binding protein n=1 Tax=Flavivirga sp. 57AJ16 TaxID=3025307 RepID=UPI002366F026|nr:ABC transporter ATP-binding protein [Flavivirga sp. 57AJ16]MDD7885103.1 ABC transporter ATP-binding protein [Flavivirga sp. 57AJ16]